MATHDVSFTYNLFKAYGSFESMNNLAPIEKKIWIFLTLLTKHIYIILDDEYIYREVK